MYETAEQLMQSDEFLGFCGAWERDRWCPAPFADWCLENVGDLAFQAAMWAYEAEERIDWVSKIPSRLFPCRETGQNDVNGHFYWMPIEYGLFACDYVPLVRSYQKRHYPTFAAAIASYLLHFSVESAKRYPSRRMAALA